MRLFVRYSMCVVTSLLLLGSVCPTFEPPPPPPLSQPFITDIELKEFRNSGQFVEAAYVQWSPPMDSSLNATSYTLLKKTTADSLFDILSENIPSHITEYYDRLSEADFPSIHYDTIFYKVFATDSLGRRGDTSSPCSLILAPQPSFTSYDTTSGRINWSMLGIQGALDSWVKIWNDEETKTWKNEKITRFSGENDIINFSVMLPKDFNPLSTGKWYYGLHIDAYGRNSLKIGEIMIP
ncbi:hypothetical protein QA601_07600 [Chitinispirillales bacterium ANBcel5]|uniref:hypothetical protein n=1 Tax=Cellulosispirillum alkaliphilum TaxID=3039283 RepID=UPI002A5312D0|nr:hypothetical protein [Chitinispirillales bacterium ANBcel5]